MRVRSIRFGRNKKAWGDTIINYTGKDVRRVDLVFGIGYGDDIQHATDGLQKIAREHKLVLDDPPVNVHVVTNWPTHPSTCSAAPA
jgi:small conductance mechanosensitive channel